MMLLLMFSVLVDDVHLLHRQLVDHLVQWDMLGTGNPANNSRMQNSWTRKILQLKRKFKFREWKENMDFEYCGGQFFMKNGIHIRHTNYLNKLKPITIDKQRISNPELPVTPTELNALRSLLCSLQWPATQSSPHLQASVSILMGQVGKATVNTLQETNKLLRFAKSNSDVGIDLIKAADSLDSVAFVVMTDAAWGVRSDGGSQLGYLIFLTSKTVLDGAKVNYSLIDWRSGKATRISRSSLNSEAQGATTGVDALELVMATFALCRYPDLDPRSDECLQAAGPATLVVDAKSLNDSLRKEHMLSITDKRTGIELMVLKERLTALNAKVRWQSSERQFADGLTKFAARQLLADRLRCGELMLVWDPHFTAAKKKTAEERRASAAALAKAKAKAKGKKNTSTASA